MDVKSVFLNGKLSEEVYVQQPCVHGFCGILDGCEECISECVHRLEAIRIFLAYAAFMGFVVYQMDVKSAFLNGNLLDLKAVNFQTMCVNWTKLCFQIKQDSKGISICQEKYVKDLLKKYDIADCASVKCPMLPPNNLGPDESGVSVNETLFRGMIGLLMYVIASRPDIQFSTYLCARYNLDKKSTSCGCQILGGKLVCCSAKKQSSIAMSSAKADVIAISNNPVLHSRTKHIDIRYHFIRDHILKGDIELHFVPTELQLADIFTKPLAEPSFTRLVAELSMLNIEKQVSDKKKALTDL
ncbi:retrovirus-related pol polyprotein from transposon TNT 1-94 [Tanacetum coccineum]